MGKNVVKLKGVLKKRRLGFGASRPRCGGGLLGMIPSDVLENALGFLPAASLGRVVCTAQKLACHESTKCSVARTAQGLMQQHDVVRRPPRGQASDLCGLLMRLSRSEPRDLRVPTQFATVQAAVDYARDGDRIAVECGIHAGDVRVSDKRLQIWAAQSVNHEAVNHDRHMGKKQVTRASVVLDAVEVSGTKGSLRLVGLSVSCQRSGADVAAVAASSGAQLTVEDCDVTSRALVSGVVARDAGTYLQLRDCQVAGCRESAVFVCTEARAEIKRCTLSYNGASGLSVHTKATAVAEDCRMLDNKENGIHVSDASLEATRCSCKGNHIDGVKTQHRGVFQAHDCDIDDDDVDLYTVVSNTVSAQSSTTSSPSPSPSFNSSSSLVNLYDDDDDDDDSVVITGTSSSNLVELPLMMMIMSPNEEDEGVYHHHHHPTFAW